MFWLNTKIVDKPFKPDSCWEWQGMTTDSGYGQMWVYEIINHNSIITKSRRKHRAHRISYCIQNKCDVQDSCVLHKCDNRLCVRPDHLFVGTRGDNCIDKVNKGRQAKGFMNGSYTDEQIKEVRRLKNETTLSQNKISKLMDMSPALVSLIVNNKHR